MSGGQASIRALATLTLDATAFDDLGPETLDRLADLVAAKLAERDQAPLLTAVEAAEIAGVHPETVRRAIRSGALDIAGYIGVRPRLRRSAVDAWIAAGRSPDTKRPATRRGRAGRVDRQPRRVLGTVLRELQVLGEQAA